MRAAVFLGTAGKYFYICERKIEPVSPAVFSCKKTLPLSPTYPPVQPPAGFPTHPGIAGCAAIPSGMRLLQGKRRSSPRICLILRRKTPGSSPDPACSAVPGAKKNGRKRTHLPSVRGSSRQMVRPGGVEPSTKSLEGSCSIQLSYGRTAVRLLTIDTVLRSVSSAQTGCGTAPGAVQDRRKKG